MPARCTAAGSHRPCPAEGRRGSPHADAAGLSSAASCSLRSVCVGGAPAGRPLTPLDAPAAHSRHPHLVALRPALPHCLQLPPLSASMHHEARVVHAVQCGQAACLVGQSARAEGSRAGVGGRQASLQWPAVRRPPPPPPPPAPPPPGLCFQRRQQRVQGAPHLLPHALQQARFRGQGAGAGRRGGGGCAREQGGLA
jgi:hypothetical protein